MKESATYQAVLEEGRVQGRAEGESRGAVKEARKLLRTLGDSVWGPPDATTAAALEQITELARLEELVVRVPSVSSWQELLAPPARPRRGKRRRSS